MKLLDNYLDLEKQIHEYFGFEEQWRILPLDSWRELYWRVEAGLLYTCKADFTGVKEGHEDDDDKIERWEIYHNIELRKDDYTAIAVDTNTDHNIVLAIFDNKRESMKRQFSNGSNYIPIDMRPKFHRPWNEQMRFDAVRTVCYKRNILDTDEVYRIFESVKQYCLNMARTEIAVSDYLDAEGVNNGNTTVDGTGTLRQM